MAFSNVVNHTAFVPSWAKPREPHVCNLTIFADIFRQMVAVFEMSLDERHKKEYML